MAGAELPGLVLDLNAVPLPLSAAALFGRQCPLELEIGVGKGRFLLESAEAHPDTGFLGIERARKYVLLAAGRAARCGLGNVRLLHTTAEDALFRCSAESTFAAIHVYFPDPWPKHRHRKRRFFRAETARRMAEVLAPGGFLLVKTDHREYAETIGAVLASEPLLEPVMDGDPFGELPVTSFQIKYATENREFHRFAYRRAGAETDHGPLTPVPGPRVGGWA